MNKVIEMMKTVWRSNLARAVMAHVILPASILLFAFSPLTACSSTKDMVKQAAREEAARKGEDTGDLPINLEPQRNGANEQGAAADDTLATRSPQTVQIRRKGRSYDIVMNIDPGDENVFVQMDIPEEDVAISPGEPSEAQSPFNRASNHLNKAQRQFYKKRYTLALKEVNKALLIAPDYAYAHALKGSIFYRMKKLDLAVQSWQAALQHDPSMNDVRRKLEEMGY
ncbi:MAG: hypothetical protein OEY64_09435 [Nitrospinota bacterium]|nr:hypothetical protein [Nitrospinota bacterium]